jgi:hypothetical protein
MYIVVHKATAELQVGCMASYRRNSCQNNTHKMENWSVICKLQFILLSYLITFSKYSNLKYLSHQSFMEYQYFCICLLGKFHICCFSLWLRLSLFCHSLGGSERDHKKSIK